MDGVEETWEQSYQKFVLPGLKLGRILSILPEDRLFLHVLDVKGSPSRTAGHFRAVWLLIPAGQRDSMKAHWHAKSPRLCLRVEISNSWVKSKWRSAQTDLCGCEIKLNASEFAQMPEDVSKFIIGHEFGHVLQWALCDQRMTDSTAEGEVEADADRFAVGLGLNKIAHMEWKVARFVKKSFRERK